MHKTLKRCSVTVGRKCTKLKKVLCYCGRKIHKTLKRCSVTVGRKYTKKGAVGGKYTKLKEGALLLFVWEENTQNLKRVLCYCGRKIKKSI